ncbi:MAG: pilin [Patescibacteria group bacterium]
MREFPNKFILSVVIFALVTALLLTFGAKTAEAGCRCRYFPGYPTAAPGQPMIGFLQRIDDGGQTCAEMYGPGKTGVDPGITLSDPTGVFESVKCDPNKGVLAVGWRIPTFSELIGNVIRLIFFIAGLFALIFLLLGGFEWLQSGGEEKKIEAARGKITNSVIGLVVMIAVLSLVIFLEQVVFGGKICLGISCPMNIGFLRLVGN